LAEHLPLKEIQRLQEMLTHPTDYQERRVERLTFVAERRFRWTIEQQLLLPKLEGEQYRKACSAAISLGIYPKKRLPDLVASGPNGEKLPVLSRHERALFIALSLLDRRSIKSAIQSDELSSDGYLRVAHQVAAFVGAAPKAFDEGLSALNNERLSDVRNDIQVVFQGWWDVFLRRIVPLREVTHVLALVEGRVGSRINVCHSFSEELDEILGGDPVGGSFSVGTTADDGTHGVGATADPSMPWYLGIAIRVYRHFSVKSRRRLVAFAQGLCLYPTTAASLASSANHCASYYLLVDAPAGAQVECAYWEQFDLVDEGGEVPVDADATVLSSYHTIGSVGSEGRCFIDTRADVYQLQGPMATCFLLVLVFWFLSRSTWVSTTPAEIVLIGLTTIAGALLGWIAQYRNSLRTFSARYLRRCVFALSIVSVGLGVVVVSHFHGAWHPSLITKSHICSFASAGALMLALLILLTQRHVRPDRDHQRSASSPMVAADLEEPRRVFLVGNLILVALVGSISIVWLVILTMVT
jgi:hypothetical protein